MSRLRKRKTRITDINSLLDLTWTESFHSQAEFLKASFEPVVTVKIEYAITDKSVAITVKAGET